MHGNVALLASLPSSVQPLDLGIGTIVVDPFRHVVVGAAAVGSGREWNATVRVPAVLPEELTLAGQATSLSRQGVLEIGVAWVSIVQ